jgi:hypothetical protein
VIEEEIRAMDAHDGERASRARVDVLLPAHPKTLLELRRAGDDGHPMAGVHEPAGDGLHRLFGAPDEIARVAVGDQQDPHGPRPARTPR